MARAGIVGAMRSKNTVREEGIERDGKMGEERIEDIESTELDIEIVTELGGRDGEIEIIIESTKIDEERGDETGSGEERIVEIEGTESDIEIVTELGGRDEKIETIIESTKIGEERVDEVAGS